MPVGIDFDNTIVRYDHVFAEAARSHGWVAAGFCGSKKQLRDAVRLLPDGEIKWQILQGEVYGKRMVEAEAFPGVVDFIDSARRRGIEMFIVSHKTRYSNYDAHKIDLREAALAWMEDKGFFDPERLGFSRRQIFFADTRSEKIAMISALGCCIFIDDLEEVFGDPGFPTNVRRVLFSADRDLPRDRTITVRSTWPEITRFVLKQTRGPAGRIDEVSKVGAHLAGGPLRSIEPTRQGGNNRLFRVETVAGQAYALKSYPRLPSDPRDRLSTEFRALQFMRCHGIGRVPKPIAKDHDAGYALYEWIVGEPARPGAGAIDDAVTFIRELHGVERAARAAAIGSASEACFSAQSVVDQVQVRLAALQAQASVHPQLGTFLDAEFAPRAERVIAHARKNYSKAGLEFETPVAHQLRCLSPSDFGFHNALAQADGHIAFLDFEYFGWDDPVKLVSDFVLHPGMDLTVELQKRFLDSISDVFRTDQTFTSRLESSLPLYALRWTMILLNEFIPERWARRVVAGRGGVRAAILQAQLGKARNMLQRAEIGGAVV